MEMKPQPQVQHQTAPKKSTGGLFSESQSGPSAIQMLAAQADREAAEQQRQAAEESEQKRQRALEAAALRERQEAAERVAASILHAQEQERRAKTVQEHYAYLRQEWTDFIARKHAISPTLHSADATEELKAFLGSIEKSVRILEPEAIARFKEEIAERALKADKVVQILESKLHAWSFRGFVDEAFRQQLEGCSVSTIAPDFKSPAREAVASAQQFLESKWSDRLSENEQAICSIHTVDGKPVVHIGSRLFGSVFITFPKALDPEALARAVLKVVNDASSGFVNRGSTLAAIDGEYQSLNFQKIFRDKVVVRSVRDDTQTLAANLKAVLERTPPTSKNSTLRSGIPATREQLEAVFPSGSADWDLWHDVAPRWAERARRQEFPEMDPAKAPEVLASLTTDENVIILVAHSDGQSIFMPAPPPEGSQLTPEMLLARKEEITANRPVVYLFCCETAQAKDLKNFASTLIECGAAAVVAPQQPIDTNRSGKFFERVVRKPDPAGETILTKLFAATKDSHYREMEVWLG